MSVPLIIYNPLHDFRMHSAEIHSNFGPGVWTFQGEQLLLFFYEFEHYAICYRLNVCISSKFISWNPNPQSDGIWKWRPLGGGHEGRVFMNEISALIKVAQERSLAPSTIWGSRPLPDTKSADTLILHFPAFRTLIPVVYKLLTLWCFVTAA